MRNFKDMKQQNNLTDSSKMQTGAHEGKQLSEVPAAYLILLDAQLRKEDELTDFQKSLLLYISANRDLLESKLDYK